MLNLEKIKGDFDKIALYEKAAKWNHNANYHSLIVNEIEPDSERVLEVGCGTGQFSRIASTKSKEVIGIDLSENMVAKAKQFSEDLPDISYLTEDYFKLEFPAEHFDSIVSIATAHHFSLSLFCSKAKRELKRGGKLIVLDLFESDTFTDKLSDFIATPISHLFKLWHNGFIKASPEEQKAWKEHGKTDNYLTLKEVRKIAKDYLPDAKIRRLLFWRYFLIWKKLR